MHLHQRLVHSSDRIAKRIAIMCESARVEDDDVGPTTIVKNEIDQLPFPIRLIDLEIMTSFCRAAIELFVDISKRRCAVDVRLSLAEKTEIRAVKNQDIHADETDRKR